MLHFVGRGSAFSEGNTSAFFVDGTDFIIIDSGLNLFQRLRHIDISSLLTEEGIKRIVVLITHTHSDHIGSLPLVIQYAYYFLHIPVVVISGNNEILEDLRFYIENLGGCVPDAYELRVASSEDFHWFKKIIPTEHSPELKGKCFGYLLEIEGVPTIYSGDTNVIEPFKEYIEEYADKGLELYIEMAVSDSPVHLCIDKHMDYLKCIKEKGAKVYLMHIDNEEEMLKKIEGTGFEFAPLYPAINVEPLVVK
ncbi:MAG: MBL fold metallo-hydrolase [Lachnospiraceae bacterium]|nr:MBL fold metallo-hydrolase [Lachnospiraceae bacterium]